MLELGLGGKGGIELGDDGPVQERERPGHGQIVLGLLNESRIGDIHGYLGLGDRPAGRRVVERTARASDAGRSFRDGQRNAAKETSATGPQNVRGRHAHAVALDFEVEVVLERQRDGILQGKIELSGFDEILNPGGVLEIGLGNVTREV